MQSQAVSFKKAVDFRAKNNNLCKSVPICVNLWSVKTYLWSEKPSLYIQHQSFEIFSLGMEYVYGVIRWLMELMEDAHIAMGKGGCREDRIAEIILGDHLRT